MLQASPRCQALDLTRHQTPKTMLRVWKTSFSNVATARRRLIGLPHNSKVPCIRPAFAGMYPAVAPTTAKRRHKLSSTLFSKNFSLILASTSRHMQSLSGTQIRVRRVITERLPPVSEEAPTHPAVTRFTDVPQMPRSFAFRSRRGAGLALQPATPDHPPRPDACPGGPWKGHAPSMAFPPSRLARLGTVLAEITLWTRSMIQCPTWQPIFQVYFKWMKHLIRTLAMRTALRQ